MKKFAFCLLFPLAAFAQDVRVNGNSTANEVLRSTNTRTTLSDRIAVRGYSVPGPNYGIGIRGDGGYIGVSAISDLGGGGSRTGVSAYASGGDGGNFGVYATSWANNASTKYGVYGGASGDGGTKYGVYGSASGAGTNYAVYCNGNGVYTGTWAKLSDSRTKKNVQDYSGALAKVMAVGVKKYDFDQAAFPTVKMKNKSEVGVLAQDLEKIFPEIVQDIIAPAGAEGGKEVAKDAVSKTVTLKGVDYVALVPVLLQAIKEQQAQIDALKKKVGG